MKNKKVIGIIIAIIAVALVGCGAYLLLMGSSNKTTIINSFKTLEESLTELIPEMGDGETVTKATTTGSLKININPLLGNVEDGSATMINNINNSVINYQSIMDLEQERMYFTGSMFLNNQPLVGLNYYFNDNFMYIFLENIFDKYITVDGVDIFSYLKESEKLKEDSDYILDKMLESLGKNITDDDIKEENVEVDGTKTKKLSLELDNARLEELSKAIVDDLSKDERAKEILGEDFTNNSTANDTESTDSSAKLIYSIYLDGKNIIKYDFGITENNQESVITYNDGSNKSIVLLNDGEEVFKGDINSSDSMLTVDLTTNNVNLGQLILSRGSLILNMGLTIDTNTKLSFELNSTNNSNVGKTDFKLSIIGGDTTIDLITLSDSNTTTDGVADFGNIDTTNSVSSSLLTDADMTTIQNNLLVIMSKLMGVTI